MKDVIIGIGATAFVLAVFGVMIWWNVAIWSECRETNSFMYCLRVIAK